MLKYDNAGDFFRIPWENKGIIESYDQWNQSFKGKQSKTNQTLQLSGGSGAENKVSED